MRRTTASDVCTGRGWNGSFGGEARSATLSCTQSHLTAWARDRRMKACWRRTVAALAQPLRSGVVAVEVARSELADGHLPEPLPGSPGDAAVALQRGRLPTEGLEVFDDGVEELVDRLADRDALVGHLGEQLGPEGVGVLDRPPDVAGELSRPARRRIEPAVDAHLEGAGALLADAGSQLGGHEQQRSAQWATLMGHSGFRHPRRPKTGSPDRSVGG